MGYHLSRGVFFIRNSVMVGCQKLNWWWRKEIRVADYNSAVFWRKVILVPSDFEIWGFKGFFLPFCSGVKSYWCRFEKKEKSQKGASGEKS